MRAKIRNFYRTLTPFGWFLFFALILAPLTIGCAWGNDMNGELIKLQSRTNGMEHSSNYEQLHKADLLNNKGKVDFK